MDIEIFNINETDSPIEFYGFLFTWLNHFCNLHPLIKCGEKIELHPTLMVFAKPDLLFCVGEAK